MLIGCWVLTLSQPTNQLHSDNKKAEQRQKTHKQDKIKNEKRSNRTNNNISRWTGLGNTNSSLVEGARKPIQTLKTTKPTPKILLKNLLINPRTKLKQLLIKPTRKPKPAETKKTKNRRFNNYIFKQIRKRFHFRLLNYFQLLKPTNKTFVTNLVDIVHWLT